MFASSINKMFNNLKTKKMQTQNLNQVTTQTHVVFVKAKKSTGVAIILSFLFGPLGMFYSTVTGGFVMLFVNFLMLMFTAGIGLLLSWPLGIIWAAVAAKNSTN